MALLILEVHRYISNTGVLSVETYNTYRKYIVGASSVFRTNLECNSGQFGVPNVYGGDILTCLYIGFFKGTKTYRGRIISYIQCRKHILTLVVLNSLYKTRNISAWIVNTYMVQVHQILPHTKQGMAYP